jgi:probable phosphoglycerate mutase
LSGDRIEAIYSSDLSRAAETADVIAQPHGITVVRDPRLREFAFGEWEGLTWPEIVATRPHLREGSASVAARYAPDGGEAFEDVVARATAFLHDVSAQGVDRVAVVTHAGVLHALATALGLAQPNSNSGTPGLKFSPAGVTRITMERGRARLIILNDVRHLDPAG